MTSIKDYIIAFGKNIKSGSSYKLDGDTSTQPLITENAVTLTNDIQFIYLGTADVCRANFDFVHCMPWYDIQTQKLYISEAQFTAIKNKRLVYNLTGESIKDRRIQKYIAKGWQPQLVENDIAPAVYSWSEQNVPGFAAEEIEKYLPTVYK